MSLEAIKIVAAAEEDAEKRRADALAESGKIVAAAEAAGKEAVRKARDLAESQARDQYLEAKAQGNELAAKIAQDALEECALLEAESGKRMDQMVTIVMERVVNRP